METVIAAVALIAFLVCAGTAVIGMKLGYNVELIFRPPIIIQLKLTRTRQPEDQQVIEPNKTIPSPRKPEIPSEGQSVDEKAKPDSSGPKHA
jgi:hypothetical protein